MAYLLLQNPDGSSNSRFVLDSDSTVIGRHPYCEISLNNGLVSREHSRITRDGDYFYLEDLQSRNGTFLNGRPIRQKTLLADRDRIGVADYALLFRTEIAPVQPTLARPKPADSAFVYRDEQTGDSINITSRIDLGSLDANADLGFRDDLASENRKLKSRLQTIIALTQSLGKALSFQELLPLFLRKILILFPNTDTVCFITQKENKREYELMGIARREEKDTSPVRVSRTILDSVIRSRSGILSDDLDTEQGTASLATRMHFQSRTSMAVPVFSQSDDGLIGVLQVDSLWNKPFLHTDLDLFVSAANQLSLHYENLYHQSSHLKATMIAQEMSMAFQVQKGFLPIEPPQMDGYLFFDYYRPARYLGGDYYDYIPLPDGRIAVAVGDVSGKGISAALLMAKLSSEVRYSLLLEQDSLAAAVQRLNSVFSDNHWDNRFITFQVMILDPKSHELKMINAGHVRPILSHPDGTCEDLLIENGGFPIGIVADAHYTEIPYTLQAGEVISLMSDGLSDAVNSKGEYFEQDQVRKVLENKQGLGAKELGTQLITAVRNFAGNTPQSDDQCLVVFGRDR